MSKRRWWDADERFRKVQDNLRKNYDNAIERTTRMLENQFAAKEKRIKAEADMRVSRVLEQLREEEQKAAKLAKEIADFRMLLLPKSNSRPLLMEARFAIDDRFLYNARDLKEIGPYIVERLCRQIQIEFTKIDWARPYEYRSMWDDMAGRFRTEDTGRYP